MSPNGFDAIARVSPFVAIVIAAIAAGILATRNADPAIATNFAILSKLSARKDKTGRIGVMTFAKLAKATRETRSI